MTRDEIKAIIGIEDVIGEHVPLTSHVATTERLGMVDYLAGESPFHEGDRIIVHRDTRSFACVDHGEIRGDVVEFVMRYHEISEEEAISMLSERIE